MSGQVLMDAQNERTKRGMDKQTKSWTSITHHAEGGATNMGLNPGISHSYDMFSNPPTCLVTISPVAGSVPRRYWLAAGSTPSLCTPPSENFTRNSYTFSLDVYNLHDNKMFTVYTVWTASSEFGTYSLCKQRRFRRACAFAQSHQNLRCSLIQAVSREEPSDRKPDPWPL